VERDAWDALVAREAELLEEGSHVEEALETTRRRLERAEERAAAAERALDEVRAEPREEPSEPLLGNGPVDLNSASFDQLRGVGMSVSQARRVIAYRDRSEGFDSVDDLEGIPGFPQAFLAELKGRLAA
jgi:DNA uptake protein ComE-like DNA-binding protein